MNDNILLIYYKKKKIFKRDGLNTTRKLEINLKRKLTNEYYNAAF